MAHLQPGPGGDGDRHPNLVTHAPACATASLNQKLSDQCAVKPTPPRVAAPQQAHHPSITLSVVVAARLRRRVILCVLGSSACYTVAAAFVKALGSAVPTWEVVFFRSAVAAVCTVPGGRRACFSFCDRGKGATS